MMIPFPYDWIAGWKKEHKIELSEKAEKELVEIMEKVDKENNKIVTREKCQDGSCDSCQLGDGYQCKYRQH